MQWLVFYWASVLPSCLKKIDNVYHSVDELKAATKLPLLGTLPFNRELKDSGSGEKSGISRLSKHLSKVRWGDRKHHYNYGGNSELSFFRSAASVAHQHSYAKFRSTHSLNYCELSLAR